MRFPLNLSGVDQVQPTVNQRASKARLRRLVLRKVLLCLCDKFRYAGLILGRIAKQLAAVPGIHDLRRHFKVALEGIDQIAQTIGLIFDPPYRSSVT